MARDEFDAFAVSACTRLYRTAYLLVGDHHRAEDLAQEVLARVYVAWPRIHGDPHGYAYRAMGHAVSNHRRWRKRHPESQPGDLPEVPSAGSIADAVVDRSEVLTALGQLPYRQRLVVVLRYYADLTEVQTAEAMHVSVGTVKTHHSRALVRLRSILGDDVLPPLTDTASTLDATPPDPVPARRTP